MITDSSASFDSILQPPSPTHYFDLLPPEVVQHIFELIFPYTLFPEQYRCRQQIFRHLCLVSKRFLQLAQPYLFQVIQLDPKSEFGFEWYPSGFSPQRTLGRAVESIAGVRLHTRTLVLDYLQPIKPNTVALRLIAKCGHRIETLRYVSDLYWDLPQRGNLPHASSFSCLQPFLGSRESEQSTYPCTHR